MVRFCPDCGSERDEAVCPVHRTPTIIQFEDDDPARLIGVVVGGRYELTSILGSGGFGTVYRALHLTTREEMVVKVLKSEFVKDPTQIQRFMNEGRAAVKLKNQHTVRVTDFGQAETGHLYIAMELLRGQELASVLKAQGRLAPLRAVRIAVAVLKSLAEAHHMGLVHRDLKPENIFLCEVFGEPELVKLIDFGIAKSFQGDDQHLTKTGFAIGTPGYMSPEQAMVGTLDGRSDLYSLGVILYRMVAGEMPFRGANPMATLLAHVHSPVPPLEDLVTEPLPQGLAEVIYRALAKSKEARFADAEDMRAALEEVLERAGEPVAAHGRAKTASARSFAPSPPLAPTPPPSANRHDDPTLALATGDKPDLPGGASATLPEDPTLALPPESKPQLSDVKVQPPGVATRPPAARPDSSFDYPTLGLPSSLSAPAPLPEMRSDPDAPTTALPARAVAATTAPYQGPATEAPPGSGTTAQGVAPPVAVAAPTEPPPPEPPAQAPPPAPIAAQAEPAAAARQTRPRSGGGRGGAVFWQAPRDQGVLGPAQHTMADQLFPDGRQRLLDEAASAREVTKKVTRIRLALVVAVLLLAGAVAAWIVTGKDHHSVGDRMRELTEGPQPDKPIVVPLPAAAPKDDTAPKEVPATPRAKSKPPRTP